MNALVLRYLIIFASSLWLDRWSKNLMIKLLALKDMAINPFLNFSLQWNKGISFSWFTSQSTLGYIALTVGILAIIILFGFYTYGQHRLGKQLYGEVFVLAGAVSNLIDRLRHGAVVDFIDVHLGSWHFATFNVADMFICVGISWLMLVQVKEVYDAYVQKNR
jgi:signal peptidase II